MFFIQLCNDRIDSCSSCLVFFRTINNSLDRPSTKNKVFATEYRLLTNIPHSTCSHKPWSAEQYLNPPLIDASRAIYCRSKKRRRLPCRRPCPITPTTPCDASSCSQQHNVLHPRTGHTTEPVKIPYGLPLTTNYIHNIRDINTIGTVL